MQASVFNSKLMLRVIQLLRFLTNLVFKTGFSRSSDIRFKPKIDWFLSWSMLMVERYEKKARGEQLCLKLCVLPGT